MEDRVREGGVKDGQRRKKKQKKREKERSIFCICMHRLHDTPLQIAVLFTGDSLAPNPPGEHRIPGLNGEGGREISGPRADLSANKRLIHPAAMPALTPRSHHQFGCKTSLMHRHARSKMAASRDTVGTLSSLGRINGSYPYVLYKGEKEGDKQHHMQSFNLSGPSESPPPALPPALE